MPPNQKLKQLQDALHAQGQVKTSWLTWGCRWFNKRNLMVFVMPITLVSGAGMSMIALERFLFENPELERSLALRERAYLESLLDMSNPWGLLDMNNPAAFIASILSKVNPEMRARLIKVLGGVDPERLERFAAMLNMVELSHKQKGRLVRMLLILGEKSGTVKLSRVLDVLERLGEASVKQGAEPKEKEGALVVEKSSEGLPQQENLENGLMLLSFLDIEDPAAFDHLIELLVYLPESVYESVMEIVTVLPMRYSGILVDLVSVLNVSQTQKLLAIANRVELSTLIPLLDLLGRMSTSQLLSSVDLLMKLRTADLNTLIDLSESMSPRQFDALLEVVAKAIGPDLSKLLSVGERVSLDLFNNVIGMVQALEGQYVRKAIGVMSQIESVAIHDLVKMGQRLGDMDVEKGLDILARLRNPRVQADLLRESTFLNIQNLEYGVDLMEQVEVKTVEKMVDLSKGLPLAVTKNKFANQMYRIANFSEKGSYENVYVVRSVVDVDSEGEDVLGASRPYQPPALVEETRERRLRRVQDLVDKVHLIGDDELNKDLIDHSEALSSRALVRGAQVFIDLDSGENNDRARRLVTTYGRVETEHRTSAIDTLHDIQSPQVSAAVDIVHLAEIDLVEDSIEFAERLKYRLGERDGLGATERAINVASRVGDSEARRKGLDALGQQRDVSIRRILKQVDGNSEVAYKDYKHDLSAEENYRGVLFTGERIERMTDLYITLDEELPSTSALQQTRASKLADALSGSDGYTLGATNRGGFSRYVKQHRKIFRIAENLDTEKDEDMMQTAVEITNRPIQVNHSMESDFDLRLPEAVRETSKGVILLKPQARRSLDKTGL
jgi:hypothetical protein